MSNPNSGYNANTSGPRSLNDGSARAPSGPPNNPAWQGTPQYQPRAEQQSAGQQPVFANGTYPAAGPGRSFDGRYTLPPGRAQPPWLGRDSVYTDPQAFGSVIGDYPSFEQYGDLGRSYTVNPPPRSAQPEYCRQQNAAAAAAAAAERQRVAEQQQQQQMQRYLNEQNDYQHFRRSHGGSRRD